MYLTQPHTSPPKLSLNYQNQTMTFHIPVEQEGDSDLGNKDDFIVQVNPSARNAAACGKRSLEADVAVSPCGSVPKRPCRSCMLRPGKRCLNYLHVV